MKKKILFLSYTDFQGGAAIASFNMFKSISPKNFDLELGCLIKKTKKKNVRKIKISFFSYIKIFFSVFLSQTLFLIFNSKTKIKRSLCILDTGLLKNINIEKFDIIHIQWLYNEVISLDEILNLKKKVVISLHDLWFCNGTFHYNPEKLNFITNIFENFLLRRKCEKILRSKNLVFTTPSIWCKDQFLNTLKKYNKNNTQLPKVFVIGNVVDFKKNKNLIKKNKFEIIPKSEFVTLFHYEKKNNFVKAYDYLFKLLKKLNDQKKFKYFIIFGNNSKKFPAHKFNNLIFYDFGFIENKSIDEIYKFADAFILTSRQETFSQLTADSLINNTPVIAFNVSGHKELIIHKKNGFLANYPKIDDLIKGMKYFEKNNFKNIRDLKNFSQKKYYNNHLKKVYAEDNFKN